ncbi:[citrate (pro-3S)-lyase] ligase [Actinobacillus arthritidis]|uniref:[citrate (pro-3S)-lyase] ligase n=1 Tax=Actinobacillus arthritidis TaxID=157339 RepID=UPI002442520B|nr:[citrate (pro-3S)-lyase] ligase [Actinobacillus arthritidis]WGE90065.1 [citrate (pro-3S)-lyase] ligase [Actinobacillus arthritidis]
MQFERVSTNNQARNSKKMAEIIAFLAQNNLSLDKQIEAFVLAYNEQDQIVACGGLAGNIIKCVAISETYRGEGLALKLASELIDLAYSYQRSELFIFTKPEYESLFHACGFYTISTAYPHVVLLENSRTRLTKQCEKWHNNKVVGDKIGAIVMNANPFTLGHRYLIEQALNQCDHLYVFVVEEEGSQFSYQDRFYLVKQGTCDLEHLTLLQSSPYIISRATFPDYFLKERGVVEASFLEIDLRLFRQYIAPALGITHRFVGTEPLCAVTAEYNRKMRYWLQEAEMESPTIQVVEIVRKEENQQPISASNVRKLYAQQRWDELEALLPASTLTFLKMRLSYKRSNFTENL